MDAFFDHDLLGKYSSIQDKASDYTKKNFIASLSIKVVFAKI